MTDTITNLTNLVTELVALRAQLSDLRQKEKDLKAKEQDLVTSILMSMGGAKSLHLEGLARITRKDTAHYEIRDREALAAAILSLMVGHAEKGMPMSEVIPLQMRASTSTINELLEGLDTDAQEKYLASAGLARVTAPSLSVTKA